MMAKIWFVFMFLLVVTFSGCISIQNEPLNSTVNQTQVTVATPAFTIPEPSTVYVEIKGSQFNPPELKVIKGTKVRWTNMDSAPHIIRGEGFESSPLNKREMWNYTFDEKGIFEYNCSIHPLMSSGRIIVE